MRVDISKWELHNCYLSPEGLRARRGMAQIRTSTAGTEYVGGFSIESASTTEVWHYLFEQSTTTSIVTMRVYTEQLDFAASLVFSQDLGPLSKRPAISYAVANNQVMINSPAFSSALYGLPGGGVITAHKTASINPDTTALEIPAGHICSFGDRMVIAQGNTLFVNDPPLSNNADPRTFTSENVYPMTGNIYDIVQGDDGRLYIFTSDGTYSLPADAIGQGQSIVGFLARIPGIETSRSRNACAAAGQVAVLQKDSVVLLPSMERIDLKRRKGKRYETASVDVEDLRLAGELSPTPDGFVVGFRAAQSFYLEGNIRQSSYSYNYGTLGFQLSYQVVAILRTRENAPLYVVRDSVIVPHTRERSEQYGGSVYAVASGRIDLPENGSPVLRRVTMKADAIGYTTGIFCDTRSSAGVAIPSQAGDFIVGTSLWDTTVNYRGRETRTVRHSFAERTSDPSIEVRVSGSDVLMGDTIEVEFAGQGRRRRDKS